MKSYMKKISTALAVLALGLCFGISAPAAHAEGESDLTKTAATSISISPVNKILQLAASSVYEDSFKVSNNGPNEMEFEVYAAPYSYTYSEEDASYKLGFNKENTYTQITRWITFRDTNGNYVEKTTYTAAPGTSVEVAYRITTPSSIPAGGQYAVLFAHTLSSDNGGSGIKTEASPGLVIYGRSEGETVVAGEMSDLKINETKLVDKETKNIINGTAKVKNTGNVDFMASGKLKVTGIFGNTYYETPATSTRARTSIIPEAELSISDSWDDTAYFGLFNVSWTVSLTDGTSETVEKLVLLLPTPIIVLMIFLLTIIIVWIIISVRKRKERRSRFMV